MVINFHELYQKYAQDIYRFAYWLCGNTQDAEDITSETFVRALTSTDTIKTETVKGYLLTIAKNLAYKKTNREKRFVPLNADLAEHMNGPSHIVENSDSLQTALRFIQTLPVVDRAALILRLQDDLSYEEIAAVLNISLAAAKVKVHRARLKLNEYMHQQEEPHNENHS
jgi:RNA polymerase sigma-70 factor (ECF subfamily)